MTERRTQVNERAERRLLSAFEFDRFLVLLLFSPSSHFAPLCSLPSPTLCLPSEICDGSAPARRRTRLPVHSERGMRNRLLIPFSFLRAIPLPLYSVYVLWRYYFRVLFRSCGWIIVIGRIVSIGWKTAMFSFFLPSSLVWFASALTISRTDSLLGFIHGYRLANN